MHTAWVAWVGWSPLVVAVCVWVSRVQVFVSAVFVPADRVLWRKRFVSSLVYCLHGRFIPNTEFDSCLASKLGNGDLRGYSRSQAEACSTSVYHFFGPGGGLPHTPEMGVFAPARYRKSSHPRARGLSNRFKNTAFTTPFFRKMTQKARMFVGTSAIKCVLSTYGGRFEI